MRRFWTSCRGVNDDNDRFWKKYNDDMTSPSKRQRRNRLLLGPPYGLCRSGKLTAIAMMDG